jgi:hypothetical protein
MRFALVFAVALMGIAADAAALERWGPTWSELTGARYYRAAMNREGAIIKSVDGRSYTNRIVKIEPGNRRVIVQSPYRKGWHGTDRVMALNIEPCQRYYINAQFAGGSGSQWEPVVAKVEHIAGCKVVGHAPPQ